MHVEACDSAASFLAATERYRSTEPLRTNVIGSIAASLLEGTRVYPSQRWWSVVDEGGEVVGAAVHTAPHPIALAPMHAAAAAVLAQVVAESDDEFTAATGQAATLDAFLVAYGRTGSPGASRKVGSVSRHLLYEAPHVTTPRVDGTARRAQQGDLDLVIEWWHAFEEEIDGVTRPFTEEARAGLAATVRRGRVWLWCVGGRPVSMAGHATPIAAGDSVVTRVGPVYTPTASRRHGFAAAATAHVTRRLLDEGGRVMLFTDAENPTSNHVYRDLGYELVDVNEFRSLAP